MEQVSQHATTIKRVLGKSPTWSEMAEHLTAGFEQALQLNLSRLDPSQQEISRSHEILEKRYSHPDWTLRI